jgi:hypothetical protein
MSLFQDDSGASFSVCRQYRYVLWRVWDRQKAAVMFIGLNPSKANEHKNDATISTVIRYARDWGFGGVYMTNLFAFVSTNPAALLINQHEKIGYRNDYILKETASKAEMIVFAWGSFDVNGRDKEVMAMFPEAYCLAFNSNGTPHHPLRLKKDIKPVKFKV